MSGPSRATITVGGVTYPLDDPAHVEHIPELESWAPLLNNLLPQGLALLSATQAMRGLSLGAGGGDNDDDGSHNDDSGGGPELATTGTPNAKKKNKNRNKNKNRRNKNKAAKNAEAPRPTLATLLDGMTYPHITDSIVAFLGRDAIPLRLVSRVLCTRVDRALLAHVYLNRDGTVDARGRRLPRTDFQRFEAIEGATRVMTFIEDAAQPNPVDLMRLSVIRMPANVVVDWAHKASSLATLVLFASAAPVIAAQWMLPSVLPMYSLPRHVRRIVYNVEFTYPPLLLAATLMWLERLTHVREVVFRITQTGPIPEQPDFARVSNTDDGMPQYTIVPNGPGPHWPPMDSDNALVVPVPEMVRDLDGELHIFDMLAAVFARELRPDLHFTLVGLETVNTWFHIYPEPLLPEIVNRTLKVMTQCVVDTGVSLENARADVEAALDFITESEYRSTVGEEKWHMETNIDFPGFKVPPVVLPPPRRS